MQNIFQHFELVEFSVFLIFISQSVSVEGILKYKSTFGKVTGIFFPRGLRGSPVPVSLIYWIDVFKRSWLWNNFLQCELHFLIIPIPKLEMLFRGQSLTPFDKENCKMTDNPEEGKAP